MGRMKDSGIEKRYKEAKTFVREGFTVNMACKEVKLPVSSYYRLEKGPKRKMKKIEAVTTVKPKTTLVAFVGTPDAVLEAVKKYESRV